MREHRIQDGCSWLARVLAGLAVASLTASGCLPVPDDTAPTTEPGETFGVRLDSDRGPVGGGESYPALVTNATWRVSSAEELLEALTLAASGQVVCVEEGSRIDLTGHQMISIPGGVILAGTRGQDGCQGGLIFARELGEYKPADRSRPLFVTGGPGVRVTGLRFEGPDSLRRTEQMWDLYDRGGKILFYSLPNADAVAVRHQGFQIDNCEMWGWTWSAVRLEHGADAAHVHHNYIHHCQRQGLGYGVMVDEATALIECNRFDWCRHAIAGSGKPGTAYEACDNIVGPNANSHAFDMHGGHDREDGTDLAGDWMQVHHNTFLLTEQAAIGIRGVPAESAEIHHNRFAHESVEQAVLQTNAAGGMNVYRNTVTPPARIAE